MTDLLNAALAYAGKGWPVFPCKEGDKRPATLHGFKDATTDPARIRRWWSSADFNIGLPTGRSSVDVLDVDVKPDGTGFPALNRLLRADLARGAQQVVRTPSGGIHLWFRPSGNGNHGSGRHHLDVRGDGGYVVVPPSVVNGHRYKVIESTPEAAGVLDWKACIRLLDPPRRAVVSPIRRHSDNAVSVLTAWLSGQPAIEGSRNQMLFWACCRAAEVGETDRSDLIGAAVRLGLPESEATRTAESALRRAGAA
jgi:hypothetical protein